MHTMQLDLHLKSHFRSLLFHAVTQIHGRNAHLENARLWNDKVLGCVLQQHKVFMVCFLLSSELIKCTLHLFCITSDTLLMPAIKQLFYGRTQYGGQCTQFVAAYLSF